MDAKFGLVRAEPDGSLVIAGSAKPGETVDVYADGTPLGSAKAESGGDWVLVPDRPVKAGGVELTLGVNGGDARSPQSFVVAIDPTHKSPPLVVASVPGEMSKVLQGLPPATPESPAVPAAPSPSPANAPAPATATATPGGTPAPAQQQATAAPPERSPGAPAETPPATPAETPSSEVATAPSAPTPPAGTMAV
ncbi:MAG TPA: hypothetical protein VHB23_07105, partial [Devosiaceae bacterium]|nr:hypothetical protein [Devosiaceae bacterium]